MMRRRRTEIQLNQLANYGIPSKTFIVLAMRLNFQSGLLDRMGNGLMGGQKKGEGDAWMESLGIRCPGNGKKQQHQRVDIDAKG